MDLKGLVIPWKKSTVALLLVAVVGCGKNLLFDPEERAVAVPLQADVAVGATHDLLVVACQDKVTLRDFVMPVATTALFVGLGRLDAAFYLPDALVKSAIPECEPVEYTVSGASLDGGAFELEPTPNPRAFKAHARKEGQSVFRAQVSVGGQTLEVTSTLRALKADRVKFAPRCLGPPTGMTVLPGHLPSGGSVEFEHQLFHGSTPLAGYGYFGISHPRLTLVESTRGWVTAKISAGRGAFTVTSEVDPGFSLQLTAYDESDFDPPLLERVTSEELSDVWVNSASDVYAVGDNGAFVHFNGAGWSAIDVGVTARLRSLWGDADGGVYLAGWSGTALRWDGTSFTQVLPAGLRDAGLSLNFVSGSSGSDLWWVQNQGALHFDGASWTSHSFATQPGDAVIGVWPVGDGHAYALVRRGSAWFVERFDGVRAVSIPLPSAATAISGLGSEVVLLTGTQLLSYRHDPADSFP